MKKFLIVLLALMMTVSLAACGGKNDNTEDGGTPDSGNSGTNTEGSSDADYKFDIKEDDHTVIITVGNTIQVYTHDGVNVTAYTTYVDCGDVETAKAVAGAININDSYYESLGLKSVKTKGSYVVQEYSEKGFACKTYEELHDLAEMYKKIQ